MLGGLRLWAGSVVRNEQESNIFDCCTRQYSAHENVMAREASVQSGFKRFVGRSLRAVICSKGNGSSTASTKTSESLANAQLVE